MTQRVLRHKPLQKIPMNQNVWMMSLAYYTSGTASPVALLGDPILRKICKPCMEPLEKESQALVATLHDFRSRQGFGRGIAAPQIGIPKRFLALYLLDKDETKNESHEQIGKVRVLFDPVITWKSHETFTLYDDCMSLPWLLCKVRRSKSISVQFRNEDDELETWNDCSQALSELLQHELDHLDGRLIVDIAEGGGRGIISREEYDRTPHFYLNDVDYAIQPADYPHNVSMASAV